MIHGPFTFEQNDLIEATISNLLSGVVEEILQQLAGVGIDSIILRGALAGGEGTARWEYGKVRLLSDIDLVVRARIPVDKSRVRALNDELYLMNAVEIQVEVIGPVAATALGEMKIRQADDGVRWRLLYGQEQAPELDVNEISIPESEAIFLLFNRTTGLLAVLSQSAPMFPDCWYQTVKTVLAMGDGLLILNRCYQPGLNSKEEAVQGAARASRMENFLPLYRQALAWKRYPPDEAGAIQAEAWTELAWKDILRYGLALERMRVGITFTDWLDYSDRIEPNLLAIAPVAVLGRPGWWKAFQLNWRAFGTTLKPSGWKRYLQRGDSILLRAAFLLLEYRVFACKPALERALDLLNLSSSERNNDWERGCRKLIDIWRAYVQ